MSIEKPLPGKDPSHASGVPLKGAEALDLYLTEIGHSIVAISEQSALLLTALAERVTLLRQIEPRIAEPADATADREDVKQESETVSRAKPK